MSKQAASFWLELVELVASMTLTLPHQWRWHVPTESLYDKPSMSFEQANFGDIIHRMAFDF